MNPEIETKVKLLADARKRRDRLRREVRHGNFDPWEKRMWIQSIRVVKKTIKRLKKELITLGWRDEK